MLQWLEQACLTSTANCYAMSESDVMWSHKILSVERKLTSV